MWCRAESLDSPRTSEAALTGESVPVAKDTRPIAEEAGLGDRIAKATWEIYGKVELGEHEHERTAGRTGFALVVAQIMVLDIVFSFDSVITAVGMVDDVRVMVAAIVIAMGVMLVFMEPVSAFVERHPSVKILALAFLILIGVVLVADGLGQHVAKGYIYSSMAFSLGVELLNLRYRRRSRRA